MMNLQLHHNHQEQPKAFKAEPQNLQTPNASYKNEEGSKITKTEGQEVTKPNHTSKNEVGKPEKTDKKSFNDALKEAVKGKPTIALDLKIEKPKTEAKEEANLKGLKKSPKEGKEALLDNLKKVSVKEEGESTDEIVKTVALPVEMNRLGLKEKSSKEEKTLKIEKTEGDNLKTEGVSKEPKTEVKMTEGVKPEPVALKAETKELKKEVAKEEPKVLKLEKVDNQAKEPIIMVVDKRNPDSSPTFNNANQSDFKTLLAQNLRETGNTEIVSRAQVIVKEADAGEIRLILKPEQLGTVRININVEDNRLLGRIVVDNPTVKAAFDDNMADLRDSMLKSGFNSANLDVSVGGRGNEEGRQQQGQQGKGGRTLASTENYFNTETISLVADIINNDRTLNVQA